MNVFRTVLESVRSGAGHYTGPPGFWWAEERGRVEAAALWTPPFHLLVSDGMIIVAPLLVASADQRCRQRGLALPGTRGPRAAATATAAAWSDLTGAATQASMVELLYQLTELVEPPRPPGSPRLAEEADVPLLARWLVAFATEAGVIVPHDPASTATTLVAGRRCWLWEVDGEPVAMAAHTPPVTCVVRVGPVYTPREHRRHGYARRLTHALTQQALAGGATDAVLFTDASNPTSNSIYRQIGFVPIEEHVTFRFSALS